MPLLLPTATSQVFVTCWLCAVYEYWVAEVAVFSTKKVFYVLHHFHRKEEKKRCLVFCFELFTYFCAAKI